MMLQVTKSEKELEVGQASNSARQHGGKQTNQDNTGGVVFRWEASMLRYTHRTVSCDKTVASYLLCTF